MAIDIEEDAISEFLEALEEEPQQTDPKPKKLKLEFEESAGIPSSRQYAKFLQDLLDTRQQLKKNSKVVLSEKSSKAVLGEIPKKMGDPGRLTLLCEFGNNMKKMKGTKMTIHMANRSVTQPRGIVEDILVKIGKFIFPIDFVVLDRKEDPSVPIILGHLLLNTAGALVDIRESKLTLRVGDEKEIFGIEDVEVIAYTNPTSWVSKEDDEMSSDEDEVTSKVTSPVVKEEKDIMELKDDEN
ncbi:uncharacterized protein LOC111914615 [Lactuca sativa]|uniref:uncharacterized protein LOC111914615 n=1 Tax=Lactuca sativa TaxID=4236 RepID=UPI000CD83D21|nr:uncharacterized protein LOC111914615 [Lactuca sativa]